MHSSRGWYSSAKWYREVKEALCFEALFKQCAQYSPSTQAYPGLRAMKEGGADCLGNWEWGRLDHAGTHLKQRHGKASNWAKRPEAG